MEISTQHNSDDTIELNIGFVSYTLSKPAVNALYKVIEKRLNSGDDQEAQAIEKKIAAYRALANKMAAVDARIFQNLLLKLTPQQQVTLAKLAKDDLIYNKILTNMSKQNQRQFKDDFETFGQITYHQAIIHMEKMVPIIKKAAQEQKALQASL